MLQEICSNIFDEKFTELTQTGFPVNAQKIAAFAGFDDFLRQYFFAEIEHYCRKMLAAFSENTNLNSQILASDDAEQIKQILFDWIEFDEENMQKILFSAIQTEIYFLFNPAQTVSNFIFNSNEICKIEEIILKFNFISDSQNFINELKNELLELQNQKSELTHKEFKELAYDIAFRISQNQSLEDFLISLHFFAQIANLEFIPLEIISIYLNERDLAGTLSKIKDFAEKNERESLSFDEILDVVNGLFSEENADSEISDTVNVEENDIEEEKNDFITEKIETEIEIPENQIEEIENIEENIEIIETEEDEVEIETENEIEEPNCEIANSEEEIEENIETVEEINDEKINNTVEKMDEEEDIIDENSNEKLNNNNNSNNYHLFTEEAQKTNEEMINRLDLMRSAGKKSYEITKEYLHIEHRNILNFKQKIDCLP